MVNDEELHPALASLMDVMHPKHLSQVLSSVPLDNIMAALSGRPEQLASVMSHLEEWRVVYVLIPVLRQKTSLITARMVPVLDKVRHPERIAAVANFLHIEVLIWMLEAIPAGRLAEFLDAFQHEDFVQTGCVITLLSKAQNDAWLIRQKVLPLMRDGEVKKIATLVKQVEASKLLEALQVLEVKGVLCLLSHTSLDLCVRLLNGPLEELVKNSAGGLAQAIQEHPHLAWAVQEGSESIGQVLCSFDEAKKQLQETVDRGKRERGASGVDQYHFGDFTRGMIADVMEQSAEVVRKVRSRSQKRK
eukprot:TRINITY_DN24402_c0_g1_i1.p1 TRINITY_DN24402_c0_g1~~TRINITY_DN24402_c0_g1_i1.p1  ORF type:complete len:304 (+),score=72.64 TRINITY_DN24402_c0_g1_i1:67-978(+)